MGKKRQGNNVSPIILGPCVQVPIAPCGNPPLPTGFDGKSDLDKARVIMVAECINDTWTPLAEILPMKSEEEKASTRSVITIIKTHNTITHNVLASNHLNLSCFFTVI